jgi:hypothetical protein
MSFDCRNSSTDEARAYLTWSGLPKIAAATARQMSTSKPA